MAIGFRRALILAATLPVAVAAQAPRQVTLKPADAKPEEEFTVIGSVRELADGRILVTDPRENRVIVMDLKAGTIAPVGRQGRGPGEYGGALPLRAIAGDSSMMFDFMSRRVLLFEGAKIVATLPPDAPLITATKGLALGADTRGNVWFTQSPNNTENAKGEVEWQPGTREFGLKDSNVVVRLNRRTLKLDTIAKVRQALSRQTVTFNAQGKFQSVSTSRPPLSTGEEAALFPDGWFAIARLDPYRVDWISPEGKVQKGAPIALTPIRMTDREKDAYAERRAAANAGSKSQPMPEGLRRDIEAQRNQFPEFFPPFVSFGATAAEDGHLLLLKPESADFPFPRYDIIDRRGKLFGTISLAKGERIVTVSKKSVYISWKDADDITRLRRHPWMQFDPIKAP